MGRQDCEPVSKSKVADVEEFHASNIDELSDTATLLGHHSVGKKPTRLEWRYLLAAILNIAVMITFSVGGYVVGRTNHNGIWNFDSVDIGNIRYILSGPL